MTKRLLAGAAALAVVLGLGVSAAYANPTAKDNDHNFGSAIGNVANLVGVGIYQDASADGGAYASADGNYKSDGSAHAFGKGGHAGLNGAAVAVAVEVGNVALVSENDLKAIVTNSGSVYAGTGSCYHYRCSGGGDASAATGSASQNNYQQKFAAGMFNNDLNTGLGSGQQQGNTAGVNAGSILF